MIILLRIFKSKLEKIIDSVINYLRYPDISNIIIHGPPGSGKYTIQPISINDVCKIVYIAIKSKKFSKKILDLVGPEKISFKQFIINSIPKSSIKIKKISLAEAYVKALTDSKFAYGIEDLNILLGDFQGNHEKLRKMSGIKFLKIRNI